MANKKTNAGANPATDALRLPPGKILQQMPGTVAYDASGKAIGIVGRDIPAQLVVQLINGSVREAAAFKRWNRL